MEIKYTTDRSTQILISLLKEHGIKKVIASPGTTNAIFVTSIQNDSYFEIFSCVDERSAAYMACGMSYTTGEPVVITCTEATASRNYLPGLTEAYYRKLPILAITGLHSPYNVGNLYTQAIDRTQTPKDTVKYSTEIGQCRDSNDEWHVNLEINKAILELTRNGGGPVHINMQVANRWDFYVDKLPKTRVIKRVSDRHNYPDLPLGKISIVIGCHKPFTFREIKA
ncbi:MAG: 2-succinyl-5-enolpyruvyl-6-hydroxy-3-cyclohexene-1-carboxylate synthase, partial [Bacteroidales bacterium]|nr:2-succinyl-5-enolpyruvyl-6-hydroxy-3-cyclohexene-1-carboxylate synthase [Bacteroidales bacterium]